MTSTEKIRLFEEALSWEYKDFGEISTTFLFFHFQNITDTLQKRIKKKLMHIFEVHGKNSISLVFFSRCNAVQTNLYRVGDTS